jgi:hypothetical protein
VLGTGKEYFGLETALTANARPVWLPYNTIDRILLELKDHRHEDRAYAKVRGGGYMRFTLSTFLLYFSLINRTQIESHQTS